MTTDLQKLERCMFDDATLENWEKIPIGLGTQCSSCATVYEMNASTGKVYVKKNNAGNYICKDCGSVIMVVNRAYPIHEFPDQLAGSGRCEYERIPYCPKCEKEPSAHGGAISFEESSEFKELQIIKGLGKQK